MQAESPATTDIANQSRSPLRWLAIPVAIFAIALVGLAASTEDREDFEERQEQAQQEREEQQGQGGTGQQGQPQPGQGNPGEGQPGQLQPGEGEPGQNGEPGEGEAQGQSQPGQGQPGQGESDSIIITTEDGDVVVQVDENGQPVALVPIEGSDSGDLDSDFYVPSDTGRVVAPDPDGNVAGIRITDDGLIETVDADEIENEDYLFRETTERLVLLRPDGSSIVLEPTLSFDLQGTERDFNRDETPAVELVEIMIERTGIAESANLSTERPAEHPGLAIRTTNGLVRFDLDREGNLVADTRPIIDDEPTDILSGNELTGLRVTNGAVEPVEATNFSGTENYLISVESNEVEIVRPDGRRIRLTPTAESGQISATRILDDGSESTLKKRTAILIAAGPDLPSESEISDDAEPLSLQTEQGLVRLDFDKDGNLVADQPNRDDVTILDPGEPSAIRVNENGEFEVVPADEIGPDDTVLVPDGDGGFDLIRPDGSRVEFRPDGENDGMTATEVGADGTETELTPNEDGTVTLEDGTEIGAIDQAEDSGPIERLIESTSEMPWLWLLLGFGLLAALSIGTAVYLHRNRPEEPFDYSQLVSPGQIPRDRFEEFLFMLQADPNPTRAVRLGFAAAENGLGGIPRKRFTETPFEWHKRVASKAVHKAKTVETICDLFARARFAPGESPEADRAQMIVQLRLLHEQNSDWSRADQQVDSVKNDNLKIDDVNEPA